MRWGLLFLGARASAILWAHRRRHLRKSAQAPQEEPAADEQAEAFAAEAEEVGAEAANEEEEEEGVGIDQVEQGGPSLTGLA